MQLHLRARAIKTIICDMIHWVRIATLGVTLCLTGCFSIETGTVPRTQNEHLIVSNYGWYLFHFIPVACGNASKDRWLPWTLFRNDVTMHKIQSSFMDYAREHGGTDNVDNLSYTSRDSVMLEIPGLELPLPIPYLLTYREIQLSGEIRK